MCGICHIAFQQGSYFQITLRLASLNDSKMPSSDVNMAIVQDVVQGNKKLVWNISAEIYQWRISSNNLIQVPMN